MKEMKGPRRYFSKTMFNPYFQSDHYQKETFGGKVENKIYVFFNKIFKRKA